jgi:hypothetical protein
VHRFLKYLWAVSLAASFISGFALSIDFASTGRPSMTLVCALMASLFLLSCASVFFANPQDAARDWQYYVAAGVCTLLGVGLMATPIIVPSASRASYLATTAGWLLIAFSGRLVLIPRNRREKRRLAGCCANCGYDLHAHKEGDRCPECGTEVKAAFPATDL